jgi:hypothetical protein
MVRALLAGTKTQTRRVLSARVLQLLDAAAQAGECHPLGALDVTHENDQAYFSQFCPYGQAGDRLWVREAWARTTVFPGTELVVYREGDNRTDYGGPWKPGIHMFRRDSRITLKVTDVRVERLQDISEADSIAEGIERGQGFPGWYRGPLPGDGPGLQQSGRDFKTPTAFPKLAYRALWGSINGPESWAANPWVWAITFERVAT